METHTIRLHRVLKATPDLVYKAFLDPDALSRWLPPNGFVCKVFHLEPKVGGTFRMSFTQFNNGQGHSFGGTYLELVPGELLRYTDTFDDPNLPGEIEVTVKLKAVSCGTDLSITQAGVPAAIPAEACYLGWQDSLEHLARLVEGGGPPPEEG
ncbi:SRPBCC family protein [Luteolibacter marinus]|uniref:SRPBCC family protein n=1 Tax=Luteolibacter marinus TaxID=2776705 RepID=UPI0018662F94|nr:SRPBCC family protein [Luteolibacter marinus]